MAQTTAKIGYGALLKRGNGASPQVFTTVFEQVQIGGFGSEASLQDATHMESPNGFLEYVLGMKDGVEIPLTTNFIPSNATQSPATGLIADHNNSTTRAFQLHLTAMTFGIFSFSALVRKWETTIEPNGVMKATFTLKVTGSITWVPA